MLSLVKGHHSLATVLTVLRNVFHGQPTALSYMSTWLPSTMNFTTHKTGRVAYCQYDTDAHTYVYTTSSDGVLSFTSLPTQLILQQGMRKEASTEYDLRHMISTHRRRIAQQLGQAVQNLYTCFSV